jgi:RNA polymerase sigma-B factor
MPTTEGAAASGPGSLAVDVVLRQLAALPSTHPDRRRLRHRAVEAGLPVARRLARRYADRGEPLADLEQVASVGLVKAVDGFDPRRGTEFWAYATPTITGEIKHYFRDSGWAVQVPRRYKELQWEIHRRRDGLMQRLHRPPRESDLAEHLGADSDDIRQAALAEHARLSISFFAAHRRQRHVRLLDRLCVDEPGYDLVDLQEWVRHALGHLPHRDRRIVLLRFVRRMTQSEIAAEVGLSQEHVSRLLARALRLLRASFNPAA